MSFLIKFLIFSIIFYTFFEYQSFNKKESIQQTKENLFLTALPTELEEPNRNNHSDQLILSISDTHLRKLTKLETNINKQQIKNTNETQTDKARGPPYQL